MKRTIILFGILLVVMLLNSQPVNSDIIFGAMQNDAVNDVQLWDNSKGVAIGNVTSGSEFLDIVNGGYNLSTDLTYVRMNSSYLSTPILNQSITYSMRLSIVDDFNFTKNIRELAYLLDIVYKGAPEHVAAFQIFYRNGTQIREELTSFTSILNTTTNQWYGNFSISNIVLKYNLNLSEFYLNPDRFSLSYSVNAQFNIPNSNLYQLDELIIEFPSQEPVTPPTTTSSGGLPINIQYTLISFAMITLLLKKKRE